MARAGGASSQAQVGFEDVMVHFSKEEWEMLEKWQRELYCEVLKDNYESLIVIGNPITRSDFIAWFERCEREKSTESHRSGAGEPSGSSCATDGAFGQSDSEPRAEALELAGMVDGGLKGQKAPCGDLEETPEHWQMPVTQQGRPSGDQHVPDVGKATQGPAGPSHPQGASLTPKPYECQECGQRFRLERLLRLHQRIGLQKPSLPCPQCGVCFPRGRQLRTHQRAHRHGTAVSGRADCPGMGRGSRVEEPLYFCTGCGESFHRYLGFLQHQKSHEEAKLWPCAQCGIAFMYQGDLAMHEESHLEETLRSCAPCGENCICEASLLLHVASHLGKNMESSRRDSQEDLKPQWEMQGRQEEEETVAVARYSCHQCGLPFRLEKNLEAHYRYCPKEGLQKSRHNWGPPECPKTCDKWVHHELVPGASGNSPRPPSQASRAGWVCSHCGKSFGSSVILCKHKAQEHKRAARPDRNGSPASGLGGRTLVGVMKKEHKCQECGKRFVFKVQLLRHLEAHAKENPHQRSLGRESLGYSGDFRKPHQMPAERPRKHRKDFGRPALPVQQRRPGKGTPCRCAECGKSFTKSYFPAHQAWHAGLRYGCALCGDVFSFRSAAYYHVQRHGNKRDFSSCPRCGEKDGSKHVLCLIDRIFVGHWPPAPPWKQEGVGPPAKGSRGKGPPPKSSQPRILLGRKQGAPPRPSCRKSLPKRFQCGECGTGFASEARLSMHRRTHTGERPFQCAECGKSFIHKRYLNLHWKIHVREDV